MNFGVRGAGQVDLSRRCACRCRAHKDNAARRLWPPWPFRPGRFGSPRSPGRVRRRALINRATVGQCWARSRGTWSVQPYEFGPIKTTEFPLFGPSSAFTDDTVLTCAVAEVLLSSVVYAGRVPQVGAPLPRREFGRYAPAMALRRPGRPVRELRQRLPRCASGPWVGRATRSTRCSPRPSGARGRPTTTPRGSRARRRPRSPSSSPAPASGKGLSARRSPGGSATTSGARWTRCGPPTASTRPAKAPSPRRSSPSSTRPASSTPCVSPFPLGGDSDTLALQHRRGGGVLRQRAGRDRRADAGAQVTPEMLGVLERFEAEFARLDR